MQEWSAEFLRQVIDSAPEGIVMCEAGKGANPVVYVNSSFERLTGFSAAELLGNDLRRLQGEEREPDGRTRLHEALARGEACRATLRNLRKDGTEYWNDVALQPMRDPSGTITHFVGFHREVMDPERATTVLAPAVSPPGGLPSWLREDRLSGLCSRAYFEELLQHDWNVGQREGRPLTLMLFDVDELALYNDTFGRAAGDACIRRVAGVVGAAFRRGSDVVARWDGDCLCALVRNPDLSTLAAFCTAVQQRVVGQRIHHPRAKRQKFVSVSIGVATLNPASDRSAHMLIGAAKAALARAQASSASAVAVATAEELEESA